MRTTTEILTCRVTPDELAALKGLARTRGTSLSDELRRALHVLAAFERGDEPLA